MKGDNMVLSTKRRVSLWGVLVLGGAFSSGVGCQRTALTPDANRPGFPDVGMPDLLQPVDVSEPVIDGAAWLPCQPTGTCSDDNWCRCSPLPQGNTFNAVWGSGASDVWAVGNSGTIVHWDGTVWSKSESGITNDAALNGVWGSSPSDAWAVGDNGIILHWNGTAWNALIGASGTVRPLYDVWGSGTSDVWAIGSLVCIPGDLCDNLVHWDGTSWTLASGSGNAIWGSGVSDLWTAWANNVPAGMGSGPPGGCSYWDGTAWSGYGSPVRMNGVWGSSTSDVWCVGESGTILHWNGTDWSADASGKTEHLRDVWGSSASDVWVVGESGTILHWNGKAWNGVDSGTTNNLHGVWGSSTSDIWVVGDGSILHHSP